MIRRATQRETRRCGIWRLTRNALRSARDISGDTGMSFLLCPARSMMSSTKLASRMGHKMTGFGVAVTVSNATVSASALVW